MLLLRLLKFKWLFSCKTQLIRRLHLQMHGSLRMAHGAWQ